MLKSPKFMLAAVLTAVLAACGGDGGGSGGSNTLSSTANVAAPVSAGITAAVVNTPISFASGVPAFGTKGATTVAFTNKASSPAFSIASGGAIATGATTFGSCIFTITDSTFPADSLLATGKVIRVDPCTLDVATSGGAANGSTNLRDVSLVLGTTISTPISLEVVIGSNGSVTVNNITVGTVTVAAVTGT